MGEAGLTMPLAMRSEAFQGPIGEFVRLVENDTEGDPAAILLGSLVAFGSLVGRSPWYPVGVGVRQRTNIYALIIGETSSGRKGTAFGVVDYLFRQVDPEWSETRIRSGLSSGEGLVHAVRNGSDDEDDQGVEDKRLLVRETEFVRVLEVGRRTGNTLSSDLRSLWDSGRAGALTRTNALATTDAHVSLVADITPDELRAKLDDLDFVNGLLNRFVPILVRGKAGAIPYAEDEPPGVDQVARRLRTAAEYASTVGRMKDHEKSRAIWPSIYLELVQDRPGRLGRLAARGSDHVRRLSMIYALAEGSSVILPEHLLAAKAVIDYSEASARFIFGKPATLDEELFGVISASGSTGVYRSELRERIGQSRIRAEHLDEALERLRTGGRVIEEKRITGKPGRNPTILVAAEEFVEVPL